MVRGREWRAENRCKLLWDGSLWNGMGWCLGGFWVLGNKIHNFACVRSKAEYISSSDRK